jgi:thiamine biosynthesis protein ThiS
MLVGRSVHSAIAAMRAEVEGVDYLIGGTVFETRSHPGKQPEGLRVLTQVASAVKVPVLGIGGITTENAPSVMKAGAAGVAVTSAILAAADTEGAAAALAAAISVGRVVLTVNGHPETLPGPTRLTEYLAARLDPRRMVAIGHNGEVVHRQDWGNVVLKEGDSLDIVHMVGGGC